MDTTDELYEAICKYPDKKISFYKKRLAMSDELFEITIQKMVRDNIIIQKGNRLYLVDLEDTWSKEAVW